MREALIQLAADGYLENVPRKGFYVKRVTEDSAREIVEIIGPLDGRAALLAVGDMTDDDIAQLQFFARFHAAGHREGPLQENTTTCSTTSTTAMCASAATPV